MKGLLLEYKYRILESGIKYVIWILFILQLIIGFFGFGAGGAVLSALLVIQINDTMIDDQACGWNQYRKILPVSGRKQVGMRYLLGITATGADLKEARKKAYEATEWVDFANKYMRHDIGKAIDEA